MLAAVAASNFLAALAGSGVATILPRLQDAFATDLVTIGLVLTVFQLVTGALLLTFGRLGDTRGHRLVFLGGFVLFVVASLGCALAPTVGLLIAGRAVQAVAASMLFANGTALLALSFPATERGQALGINAVVTYAGLSVGPALAGWLNDTFAWQAVFAANVPVGAALALFSWRALPSEPIRPAARFDLGGTSAFVVGLGAFLLTLQEAPAWGWTSARTLAGAVVAVAGAVVFALVERGRSFAMFDLALLRRRAFSGATLTAITNYVGVSVVQLLLPFYLIHGRGMAAAQAGLILSAQPIAQVLSAPVSGWLSDRVGTRLPSAAGTGLLAIGLVLLARLGADATTAEIVVALVVAGLGSGTFVSPNTNALMSAAPLTRQGMASGVVATARYIGFGIGTALAAAALSGATGGAVTSAAVVVPALRVGFGIAAVMAVGGALSSLLRDEPRALRPREESAPTPGD